MGLLAIRYGGAERQRGRTPVDVVSADFLSSYEWRRVRMEALVAHGARCQCCGATAKDGKRINVDHIKPRKKKYPELALDVSNLQVLCEECNHGKGNWNETDWRDAQLIKRVPRYEPQRACIDWVATVLERRGLNKYVAEVVGDKGLFYVKWVSDWQDIAGSLPFYKVFCVMLRANKIFGDPWEFMWPDFDGGVFTYEWHFSR